MMTVPSKVWIIRLLARFRITIGRFHCWKTCSRHLPDHQLGVDPRSAKKASQQFAALDGEVPTTYVSWNELKLPNNAYRSSSDSGLRNDLIAKRGRIYLFR